METKKEKEEKSDEERTTKEQKDLLELFSTRLANVKETLREETKRAMDAAVGANAKVVKLLETLEACETEDGVVLYHRDVSGTGGGGGGVEGAREGSGGGGATGAAARGRPSSHRRCPTPRSTRSPRRRRAAACT